MKLCALQLHGHRLAVPHADRHQLAHHVVVGDGLALVLAARDGHRHVGGDHREPQRGLLGRHARLAPRRSRRPAAPCSLTAGSARSAVATVLPVFSIVRPIMALVGAVDVDQAVHDGLRRVDGAVAAGVRVGALALAELRARQRILPAEIVPIVDRQRQRDDVVALGQTCPARASACRAGGAALAGEQLDDGLARRRSSGRHGRICGVRAMVPWAGAVSARPARPAESAMSARKRMSRTDPCSCRALVEASAAPLTTPAGPAHRRRHYPDFSASSASHEWVRHGARFHRSVLRENAARLAPYSLAQAALARLRSTNGRMPPLR